MTLPAVTVEQFRAVLVDAAAHVDAIQPPALREPISLWLRGVEERARREGWRDLLSRQVVYEWTAAQAILTTGTKPDLAVPDSIKTLRETLCRAQTAIGSTCVIPRREIRERAEHDIAVLQRLIDDCDRQRPLGSDGKHGDRHTATCGCEDKTVPHAAQTCGFRWDADDGGRIGTHQCGNAPHGLAAQHDCDCGARRPGVIVLRAAVAEEA